MATKEARLQYMREYNRKLRESKKDNRTELQKLQDRINERMKAARQGE